MHQGVGITACIAQKDVSKFADALVEGHAYMIKKFQVSRQARKYNVVPNTYTIFFTSWIVVEDVPAELSNNLPLYVFNFVDFEDLDRMARDKHSVHGLVGTC